MYNAYYINLDRSVERNAMFLKNCCNITSNIFSFKRISAYDGKNLNKYKDDILIQDEKLITNPYEYACSLSHIKAILTAYNNYKEIFIFEDDIRANHYSKWSNTISNIVKSKPTDCNCIQFTCSDTHIMNSMLKSKKQFIPWKSTHTCTGCYYMDRKGMKKIIDRFYKNCKICLPEMNYKADCDIIYKYTNTYTYATPLFTWQCKSSTIRSNIQGHIYCVQNINKYYENKLLFLSKLKTPKKPLYMNKLKKRICLLKKKT